MIECYCLIQIKNQMKMFFFYLGQELEEKAAKESAVKMAAEQLEKETSSRRSAVVNRASAVVESRPTSTRSSTAPSSDNSNRSSTAQTRLSKPEIATKPVTSMRPERPEKPKRLSAAYGK